jgi:hypothetical protein
MEVNVICFAGPEPQQQFCPTSSNKADLASSLLTALTLGIDGREVDGGVVLTWLGAGAMAGFTDFTNS